MEKTAALVLLKLFINVKELNSVFKPCQHKIHDPSGSEKCNYTCSMKQLFKAATQELDITCGKLIKL